MKRAGVIAASLFLVAIQAIAQQTVDKLVATGRVAIEYQDPTLKTGPRTYQARQNALEDARKNLLSMATRNLLGEPVFNQRQDELGSLLASPAAYLTNEEIIDEGTEGDYYKATIKASFDFPLLKSNLDGLGIAVDALSRRTVMVLVDEYFSADLPPGSEVQVAELIRTIIKADLDAGEASYQESLRDKSDYSSAGKLAHSERGEAEIAVKIAESASVSMPDAAARRKLDGQMKGEATYKASLDGKWDIEDTKDVDYSKSMAVGHIKDKSEFDQTVVRFFPPEAMQHRRNNSIAGARIERTFREKDIRLVDKETVTKFREAAIGSEGYLTDLLMDDNKMASAALKASRDYNADAFVAGAVSIIYEGEKKGEHTSRASMVAKVVDASTGEILASTSFTQGGISRNAKSSADIATERLGNLVGGDLRDQLMVYWRKRAEKGEEIEIRVIGIQSTRDKVLFVKTLRETPDVERVEERVFDRNQRLLELVVTCKGDLNDFGQNFLEKIYELDSFSRLEEQQRLGRNITYAIP